MPRRNRDSAPRRGKPDAAELARTTALLRRVRAGDTDAFEELVHLYRSHVAGIAYRIVRDHDDAKDVTQMVFVKLYHNLRRYDPNKRFTTWLYRIATNAAIDYVRKFKKQKFELLEETWAWPMPSRSPPRTSWLTGCSRSTCSRRPTASPSSSARSSC